MFGGIFKQITGRSVSDCKSLTDINQAVEDAKGTPLGIKPYENGVVHKRGNVFGYANKRRDLDSELDRALGIRS